jgi:hypothetical protein
LPFRDQAHYLGITVELEQQLAVVSAELAKKHPISFEKNFAFQA